MPTLLVVTVLAAVLAATALQLLIPKLAERRIGRRLTESGGIAEVEVVARPALRLLAERGDALRVRGSGLTIAMAGEPGGLTALEGFDEVEVDLTEVRTGPFEVSRFELARHGRGRPYRMRAVGRTSGAELLGFGGEQLGIAAAGALAALARGAPLGTRSFAVEVEVELLNREGALEVVGGAGTMAGYPAGPIATAIAAAVARRLDVTP